MAAALPYPNSPVLEKNMAVVCLVVNVFAPGIGTIIAGVLAQKPMIGRGVAQLLLSIILVGWIWAIVDGVRFLSNATAAEAGPVPAR